MRSQTEKEKRIRDNHARADSDKTQVQNVFKRGWDACFDAHLIEMEKLTHEVKELKSFKMKYENSTR